MRNPILLCTAVLFIGCKEQKVEVVYRLTNSQILVTSDFQDKAQLFDSCKDSKITISNDSIVVSANCILDKTLKITPSEWKYEDSAKIASNYLLLTQRYPIANKVLYKTLNLIFLNDDKLRDSIQLLFLDSTKLLLIYEPYLLEFKIPPPATVSSKSVWSGVFASRLLWATRRRRIALHNPRGLQGKAYENSYVLSVAKSVKKLFCQQVAKPAWQSSS